MMTGQSELFEEGGRLFYVLTDCNLFENRSTTKNTSSFPGSSNPFIKCKSLCHTVTFVKGQATSEINELK